MIDGCRDRGLNPLVTLVHFTQPRWLLHDGGWTGERTGDRIARYTEFVAPVLVDAAYVATINEPNLMATQPVMARMAMSGQEIVGLPRPDQEVADALIGLHGRMKEALGGIPPRVGWTLIGRENIAEEGGEEVMRAERAAFEDQFLAVARDDDWVGQQIYTCARFGPDGLVAPAPELQTLAHGMERRPEALGAAVARAAEVLGGGTPILVTENGIATADDSDRIRFTTDALTGLAAAIDGGADVRGYLHWSLLDNFEWMLGYRPTFGLVAVDRETFARTPKPSLAWLGEVARRNGLPG
jgi:beta-glucosidase